MVTWQAEGNAGKKTIIVNFKSAEGKRIAFDLVKKADIVLMVCYLRDQLLKFVFYNSKSCFFFRTQNKSDEQVKAMGLDREALDQINAKAIHLNVSMVQLCRVTISKLKLPHKHGCLQVQARRGENIDSESGMWPGYDPALQVCQV